MFEYRPNAMSIIRRFRLDDNSDFQWRPAVVLAMLLFSRPAATGQDAPASASGIKPEEAIIGRFEKDSRLSVKLVADSTQVAHPIAFSVDDFGRVFVAESFRYIDQKGGWTDIRYRMPWMDEDLASRSMADRRKLYESRLGEELADWRKASERVRQLEEPDQAGVYRKSSVFAEGFADLLDGTIAGLLATRDQVYVTNIPSLWELKGAAGSKETARKALHSGFGVRLGYLGHDLHGLCWGPDGRLYFSIGDRGARVEKDGKLLIDLPDTGGVFRCEADGSKLELFAYGLRNPQELAFDAFGNLWTCDNNADKGDLARWVWVLPGGDSGWRIGYQHLNVPVALGAWTSEKIWHPAHREQAGHIVPPVANLAQGPSGVAAHPGTGLSSQFTGQFLVCDYLGEGGGVHAVSVRRKGAGFEMLPPSKFLWSTPANDIDFAPDGAVLFTTWTGGISPQSGGALYRVESPGLRQDPPSQSTAAILKADPAKSDLENLGALLEHPDMRVRRQAQFELVRRGESAKPVFRNCIANSPHATARVTAIWGLAQLQRLRNVALPADWNEWATDADPEVRAAAARAIGESKPPGASGVLAGMLDDPDDQVKLWASLALSESPSPKATEALIRLAEAKADADPWLRHGISSALASCAKPDELKSLRSSNSPAVRRAALVALRKAKNPGVADFLDDRSPMIVADAARAIYEERIDMAAAKLAAFDPARSVLSEWSGANRDAVLRRWMHANLREGQAENAMRIARFVADTRFAEPLRVEALSVLADWRNPRPFDGIQGLYFPIAPRDRIINSGQVAFRAVAETLFEPDSPDALVTASLSYLDRNRMEIDPKSLARLLELPGFSPAARSKALELLVVSGAPGVAEHVRFGLKSAIPELKLAAIGSLDRLAPADRLSIVRTILETGSIQEKQRAVKILGAASDPDSAELLKSLVDEYHSSNLAPELRLDVREAAIAASKANAELAARIETSSKSATSSDAFAPWRDALAGGDAAAGQALFRNRADLSCLRCHQPAAAKDRVGPALDDVGARLSPEQILRSVVHPNFELARGFETVALALNDGSVVAGLLLEEFPARIVLRTGDGKTLTVDKTVVEERAQGVSLMPEGLAERMTLRELRDLTAYLQSLRGNPAKAIEGKDMEMK